MKWTSNEDIPGLSELLPQIESKKDEIRFLIRYKDKPYSLTKINGGYIIISPEFARDYINFERAIIGIVIIITILALCCTLHYAGSLVRSKNYLMPLVRLVKEDLILLLM